MKLHLRRPRHATVVAYLALFVALGGTAYAATGGAFILGRSNSEGATASLTNTGSGSAVRFITANGSAQPFTVSNRTRIANLNADMVDGLHASSFQRTLPSRLAFTNLALLNNWTGDCGFGVGLPGVALDAQGVVHLRGGICNGVAGSSSEAFVLPARFRPTQILYLAVDECGSTTGRLVVGTDGTVFVEDDLSHPTGTDSSCFTSLAGVSYTLPY